MMSSYDHSYFATLIWQIADLLRGDWEETGNPAVELFLR